MGKGWTVISASPLTPSTVAVIRTGPPRALAVITPDGVTETATALLEDQATVRPGTTRPLAVLGVAVSWAVPPRTREPLEGETSTVATRSTSAMPSPPLPQEVSATNAASPASVQRAVMGEREPSGCAVAANGDGRKGAGDTRRVFAFPAFEGHVSWSWEERNQVGCRAGGVPAAVPTEPAAAGETEIVAVMGTPLTGCCPDPSAGAPPPCEKPSSGGSAEVAIR